MKMATIITVYKQPQLVERLILAMQYNNSFHFFLHIDAKVDPKPFQYLAKLPNTFIIKKRVKVYWAGFSLLEALLCGMEEIFKSEIKFDYINHMSGQCYPIKPAKEIYNYFRQNIGFNFLSSETPPSEWWDKAAMRYKEYHLFDFGIKGGYRLGRILTRLLPVRKLPFDYALYGGSFGAYWTLDMPCARYIYDVLRNDKKIRNFFRISWGPDEYLINTLIMGSPFKNKVINDNQRLIDWSEGGWHPAIFTVNNINVLANSPKMIARKFDLTVDSKILDLIDQKLLT